MPWISAVVLTLFSLSRLCDSKPGYQLVQSNFYVGTEDWTVEGIDSEIKLDGNNGKLIVSDTRDQVWYFVAPSKFLGDQSAAYGGKLVFTLGHFFFNSDDKDALDVEEDVVLASTCDWSLSIKVFKKWDMAEEYSVTLSETAGWKDSRTGNAPGLMDFLGMLSNLRSVKIRGGYYRKEEMTNLGNVQLLEGTAWKPCCNAANSIDYCAVRCAADPWLKGTKRVRALRVLYRL
jgi:hypothetical protein